MMIIISESRLLIYWPSRYNMKAPDVYKAGVHRQAGLSKGALQSFETIKEHQQQREKQQLHRLSRRILSQPYHKGMALDLREISAVEVVLFCYLGLHLCLFWQLSNSLGCTHLHRSNDAALPDECKWA